MDYDEDLLAQLRQRSTPSSAQNRPVQFGDIWEVDTAIYRHTGGDVVARKAESWKSLALGYQKTWDRPPHMAPATFRGWARYAETPFEVESASTSPAGIAERTAFLLRYAAPLAGWMSRNRLGALTVPERDRLSRFVSAVSF